MTVTVRRVVIAGAVVLLLLFAGGYLGLRWFVSSSLDPAYFEEAILAFEQADREAPPAPGAVVFVGSSSIRAWSSLAEDMAGIPVLNRGFGGSQLVHVVHNADRIITPYAPTAVVVYAGDNDLVARTGKTAEVVRADFELLVERIRAKQPEARIYFLSIKPSKVRWDRWPEMNWANALVERFCADDPNLSYVDVAGVLLGPEGTPRDDVFLLDGLHMNETGYRAWSEIVRPLLLRDLGTP